MSKKRLQVGMTEYLGLSTGNHSLTSRFYGSDAGRLLQAGWHSVAFHVRFRPSPSETQLCSASDSAFSLLEEPVLACSTVGGIK